MMVSELRENRWLDWIFVLYAFALPISLSVTYISLGLIFFVGFLYYWQKKEMCLSINPEIVMLFTLFYSWSAVTGLMSGHFVSSAVFRGIWELTPIILFPLILQKIWIKKEWIILAFLASSFLICLLGLIQYLKPSIVYPFPQQLVWGGDFKGLYTSHFQSAGLCSIASILSFALALFWSCDIRKKVLLWIFFVLNIVALLLTMTRSYYISVSLAIVLLMLLKNWRWFVFGTITFAAISVFVFTFPNPVKSRFQTLLDPSFVSNKARVYMWKAAVEMIKDHPMTGIGRGNWEKQAREVYFPRYEKEWIFSEDMYPHPHNIYLSYWVDTGIVGLMLFLGLWGVVIWKLFTIVGKLDIGSFGNALIMGTLLSLVNLLVAGLFEHNFVTLVILLLISMLIGLSIDECNKVNLRSINSEA